MHTLAPTVDGIVLLVASRSNIASGLCEEMRWHDSARTDQRFFSVYFASSYRIPVLIHMDKSA